MIGIARFAQRSAKQFAQRLADELLEVVAHGTRADAAECHEEYHCFRDSFRPPVLRRRTCCDRGGSVTCTDYTFVCSGCC
ncbi:hypothetical protein WEH80_25200 [Actinomycetes bacterium KLBMP 9759]